MVMPPSCAPNRHSMQSWCMHARHAQILLGTGLTPRLGLMDDGMVTKVQPEPQPLSKTSTHPQLDISPGYCING